jgi:hypothetical protein
MPMSERFIHLYQQKSLPVFQNRMYATREEALACPQGDVTLVQDLQTGLIFNQTFRPDLVVYDSAYQNEQGLSAHFQAHLRNVMEIIDRGMGHQDLVEVGCGKGLFLELLLDNGFEITGFDPTYEGSNPRVRRHFFEKGVGVEGRGMILRHVLEHIPDPVAFLKNLSEANHNKGRVYIEVPCFDWICEHKTWFDIFHEHVNYFRLEDFHRMFGSVVESGRVFGGQYIYVVAELSSIRQPRLESTGQFVFPSDFTSGIHNNTPRKGVKVVIWGGASKGAIFSLLRSRAGFPVDAVIDINPAKQGKFLPVTGLKVESPEAVLPTLEPGTPIFVMNSNYLEEIKLLTNNKFTYIPIDHE